jgi:hypothetical protein
VKWQVNKSFDLSLKGSYENVLLTSITNANSQPLNTDVDYTAMSGLDDAARNYFRVDLRAGYRY